MWNVNNTAMGNLNAVAASLAAQKQERDVTLGSTDLSFASPGGQQLTFERYYDSAYLGNKNLGPGWQPTRSDLQFQLPTYVDDYRLMRDGSGNRFIFSGRRPTRCCVLVRFGWSITRPASCSTSSHR